MTAALLPAVDRIARTRAADELDAAAERVASYRSVSPGGLAGQFRARATALRAEP